MFSVALYHRPKTEQEKGRKGGNLFSPFLPFSCLIWIRVGSLTGQVDTETLRSQNVNSPVMTTLPLVSWNLGRSLAAVWLTPLAESNHIMRKR